MLHNGTLEFYDAEEKGYWSLHANAMETVPDEPLTFSLRSPSHTHTLSLSLSDSHFVIIFLSLSLSFSPFLVLSFVRFSLSLFLRFSLLSLSLSLSSFALVASLSPYFSGSAVLP